MKVIAVLGFRLSEITAVHLAGWIGEKCSVLPKDLEK